MLYVRCLGSLIQLSSCSQDMLSFKVVFDGGASHDHVKLAVPSECKSHVDVVDNHLWTSEEN